MFLRSVGLGAFSSIGIAVVFTFGSMIVATKNVILASLVILTILCIVAIVMGMVFLVGWKIDTIILVCLTVLVGFAVDYVVHYAIAYDEAYRERGLKERGERIKFVTLTMSGMFVCAISTMTM